MDVDKRTKEWFNTENSPKQVLNDDFLCFLQHRAIGNADITPNPPSHGLRAPSILAELEPLANPPSSSTSVITHISTSLAILQNSDSWQRLGVEPSLFSRSRFSPQTPPPTPTPPIHIPNPQSIAIDKRDLPWFQEPPHTDLSSANTPPCPINPIDNQDFSELPHPENTFHPMDIDDTDLPPAYQPQTLTPSESMEVCQEESPLSSIPHPTPIHNENGPLSPRRETSWMEPDNCYERAFSEERNRVQNLGAKSLAETFNNAANANASGSTPSTRRKGRKSDIAPKKKKARFTPLEAIKPTSKKEVIDLSLEEVSNYILFRPVF
jgi:hypothetical protein